MVSVNAIFENERQYFNIMILLVLGFCAGFSIMTVTADTVEFTNSNTSDVCNEGYYGPDCQLKCSAFCVGFNSTCDPVTGNCHFGCENGWLTPKCDVNCSDSVLHCQQCIENLNNTQNTTNLSCVECEDGFFLSQGLCEPCSHCLNASCDNNTGECTDGCAVGWYSTSSFKNCSEQCNQNCEGHECAGSNGLCSKGCISGYYGASCEKTCPKNCYNDSCHRIFGVCNEGCKEGYTGNTCQYTCENCINDTCDPGQNKCQGCKPQWRGDYCQTSCKDCIDGVCSPEVGCKTGCVPGKYGNYCNYNCSKNCFACEQHIGSCRVCMTHYGGLDCLEPCNKCKNPYESPNNSYAGACPPGFYGLKCNESCSPNCDVRESESRGRCYKYTGLCIDGCKAGYYGSDCQSVCGFCNSTLDKNFCDSVTGKCPGNCLGSYYGDDCKSRCSVRCFAQNCYQDTGYCSQGCITKHYEGRLCDKTIEPANTSLSTAAIVGISVGSSVAVVLILVSIILFVRRQKHAAARGCIPQWGGNFCEINCKDCIDGLCSLGNGCENGCVPGKYGKYCNFDCGENCFACEQNTGTCRVCMTHYGGLDCLEPCYKCKNPYESPNNSYAGACPPGFYGLKCNISCSPNCDVRESESRGRCYKYTGLCIAGCKAGYYGSDCKSVCGFCNNTLDKNFCDPATGKCPGNCLGDAYYGDNCKRHCSLRCFAENCYQDTGYCSRGCYEHYEGRLCDKKIEPRVPTHTSLSTAAIVGIVIGTSAAVALILGSIILFLRRQKHVSVRRPKHAILGLTDTY